MKNRAFFLLTASFIMLLTAVVSMLERSPAAEEAEKTSAAVVREEYILPAAGKEVQKFGAVFSEELGQWSMRDETVIETDESCFVYAPADGRIERIEAGENGCRITIAGGEVKVLLYPVSGVRVFENSMVQAGALLGTAAGRLSIRAERAGRAIDFMQLAGKGHDEES